MARVGALRFKRAGDAIFEAPSTSRSPTLTDLRSLFSITERVLRDEETDADLQLVLAPGSSLGGARPKASVIDAQGQLAIAKFPIETDDYAVERWECIAMGLARRAGIATPQVELLRIANKPVLLSRRFDRTGPTRIPFLSALSMLGLSDGQRSCLLYTSPSPRD